ncbi:hypothetical protein B0H66DRAFT_376762 [Apodospora peruviana]|uniref:Uncharacterized protein n=1 Tax=Apodospora peruviana TaxID=516989 RepID=A0AAE0HXI3_9PEZI|nr:hypothetical protein B0H66DRAFT_376762 [Apodospora peruviana]
MTSTSLTTNRVMRALFDLFVDDFAANKYSSGKAWLEGRGTVPLVTIGNTLAAWTPRPWKAQLLRTLSDRVSKARGRGLEAAFTGQGATCPAGTIPSHFRTVRYHMGDLNCVIQSEVDTRITDELLQIVEPVVAVPDHHSMVAEMKVKYTGKDSMGASASEYFRITKCLWFPRIPFFIAGAMGGPDDVYCEIVASVNLLDRRQEVSEWGNDKHVQLILRKVASLLGQLRGRGQGTRRLLLNGGLWAGWSCTGPGNFGVPGDSGGLDQSTV